MDVFDLYAKVSLDSTGYTKGIQGVSDSATKLKSNLGSIFGTITKIAAAATAAVAGASIALGKKLVNSASELAQYGDNIDKMSQKMGMSAEAYQEWDAVLQHSGTSIETMKASMKTLAIAAQTNNKAFQQLGITEKELKSLSQEELFSRTIEELQKVEDTTQRTYLAGKLLGRGATELGALLNTSAEETKKMKERVHELGGVMSNESVKAAAKFQNNLQDMQTAMSGLKRGIINDTLPAFNDLMEGFTKLIAGEEGAEDKIDEGVKKLETSLGKIAPKIQKLSETLLPKVIKVAGSLISELAKNLPKLIAEIAPVLFDAGVDIITGVTQGIYDTLSNSNFDEKAKVLSEKLNSMVSSMDTKASGEKFAEIINKVITAAFNIVTTVNFGEIATKLTDWLNGALKDIDFKKLGNTVGDAFKGVWDFIRTALDNIDWEDVGNAIGDFISGVDWGGILNSIFDAIGAVIKAMPDLLKGIVDNLDFESASSFFALLFAPKMAGKLLDFFKNNSGTKATLESAGKSVSSRISDGMDGQGVGKSFGSKLSSGLSAASTVISAAIAGWELGTMIYNAAKPGIDKITDALLDLQYGGEETQGKAEADQSAKTYQMMNKFKNVGIDWVRRENIEKYDKVYTKALSIYGLMQKYPQLAAAGYTGKTIANDPQLYEDLLKGKLPSNLSRSTPSSSSSTPLITNPTDAAAYERQKQQNWKNNASFYQPGSSAATSVNAVLNSNIYLDTGKLVGGTSRTSAVQNNYAMRGYAT